MRLHWANCVLPYLSRAHRMNGLAEYLILLFIHDEKEDDGTNDGSEHRNDYHHTPACGLLWRGCTCRLHRSRSCPSLATSF